MTQAEFWSLLIDWGYLAVILAVFIEGEIFLIMVGIATAAAMFNYPLVILAATIELYSMTTQYLLFRNSWGREFLQRRLLGIIKLKNLWRF